MSSSLSDALNFHLSQPRIRTHSSSSYSDAQSPVIQQSPPQYYVPHRSELELAIAEPPPPPPPALTEQMQAADPNKSGIRLAQEVLRIVRSARDLQEVETEKRLAWEKEQEEKFAQRHADLQRQLSELRSDISAYKAATSSVGYGSPIPGPPAYQQQWSSSLSVNSPMMTTYDHSSPYFDAGASSPAYPLSPSLSPHLVSAATPSVSSVSAAEPPMESDDEGVSSDSLTSQSCTRIKRNSSHDTRCLTIQHAMRIHILLLMGLENDKHLPDSYIDGAPCNESDPVRFVWEKTVRQSTHNQRMKTRILEDLKSRRQLYEHVPRKDFRSKTLSSVFDQAFLTMRQKFKGQRNENTAIALKRKDEVKSRRARRLSRKKIKLSSRADARAQIGIFNHTAFDGALVLDCMSSDESDYDTPTPDLVSSREAGLLRRRGYPWRSTQLQNFFSILDRADELDKSSNPKRGSGKKGRFLGPVKDGMHLPPNGVSTWMISKRWKTKMQKKIADLSIVLDKRIVDVPGFDANSCPDLGPSSDPSESEDMQEDAHSGQASGGNPDPGTSPSYDQNFHYNSPGAQHFHPSYS